MTPTARSKTTIATSGVEPTRRLDYWRDMISSTFVALDCDALARGDFFGSLETDMLRDLQFSRVVSDAQHVARSRSRIRQSPGDYFLVSLQCEGTGWVIQEDRVATLSVGDFALYDAAYPYELEFKDHFEQLVLRLPRHYLSHRIACPERLTAVAFQASQGSTAIISTFMRQLYGQLERLEPGCVAAMHQALVDLLVAGLSGNLTQGSHTANRLGLRQRVRNFAEERLADCSLDCQQIAAAHGISLRYLNKLFADDDMPLSEWIWLRRLQKARAAIERSRMTGQSITQIAYDWGFKDPAHFSRAFKARYGVTPSAFRQSPD
ncbi:MAG TPA: helix-turn-helix domain-containing protein [Steroidobacteraceae bacterium]|jgi:AraC-like DNA-binding protein|nr:helix-turn-helix domain-containing protein [Steroidobacteraceae bacterium]